MGCISEYQPELGTLSGHVDETVREPTVRVNRTLADAKIRILPLGRCGNHWSFLRIDISDSVTWAKVLRYQV